MMMRFPLIALMLLAAAAEDGGRWHQMHVERLPDLNIPRSAHAIRVTEGCITVLGGHTTGFVPTPTAEYYEDGSWHLVNMTYTHDNPMAAMLPGGEVFIAGGSSEAFGVGQSFGAELYSPATHSFRPLPILDRKRSMGTAANISGSLVISGNWYADDAIASYSLQDGGKELKTPSQARCSPYILQTSRDNAIIFCGNSERGEALDIVVDRLNGDPFEEPLLKEWSPAGFDNGYGMENCFIGNESLGGYAHILTVTRKDGRSAVMKVVGESFSLLETSEPLPMKGIKGEPVTWTPLMVDSDEECAYIPGVAPESGRFYLCTVGYGEALKGRKAPVTLYYTDFGDIISLRCATYALLPGGRLACIGGITEDNYNPLSSAVILHTRAAEKAGGFPWWALVAGLLAIAIITLAFRRLRHLNRAQEEAAEEPEQPRIPDLLTRIKDVIETQELYKRKDLRLADVAQLLGTNATYISACINGQTGRSFTDFVNDYRVGYAKDILKQNPDMKISVAGMEAGFSSEASFYRNFKDRTGMSPSEWLSAKS